MRRKITTLALAFGAAVPLLSVCTTTRAYAQSRAHDDKPFTWSGTIQAGHSVYVRNLNGAVRVEAGTGDKVEVRAEKQWRRGNPDDVKITVKQVGPGNGDVLVCALWNDRSSCDEDGYHSHDNGWFRGDNDNRNDVSVEFVVRLPAGVKVDASTVNGSVDVDGATSDVVAHAVNGSVEAHSTGGAVSARTTNGNVEVSAAKLDIDHSEFRTVNGTVTVSLPASVNADVDMETVNGSLTSDFPLTVQGSFNPRRLRATLGKGGASLRLTTVNGSIRLRKLS
jgi:Putative adhesin